MSGGITAARVAAPLPQKGVDVKVGRTLTRSSPRLCDCRAMDVLVVSFVAALFAEWGDRSQLLAAALTGRSQRPVAVFGGLALAAIGTSVAAAVFGALLAGMIAPRAMSLLIAIAFLYSGFAGLFGRKVPSRNARSGAGAFAVALISCAILQAGDRTQWITLSLSGGYHSPALAACGAAAGMIVASAPAAFLGEDFAAALPVRGLRIAGAALLLLAGIVIGLSTLQLI